MHRFMTRQPQTISRLDLIHLHVGSELLSAVQALDHLHMSSPACFNCQYRLGRLYTAAYHYTCYVASAAEAPDCQGCFRARPASWPTSSPFSVLPTACADNLSRPGHALCEYAGVNSSSSMHPDPALLW
jgi:hypothetical protein